MSICPTIFPCVGAVLTVVTLVVIAWLVLRPDVRFGWWTRFGLCLTAAGLLLSSVERVFIGTPFADWSHVVMRIGLLVFLAGLAYGGFKARRDSTSGKARHNEP